MEHAILTPAFALALASVSSIAQSQPYPTVQTLKLVVPFAAGGAVDSKARSFAKGLSVEINQQAIVINKEGAGGTIGFWHVARATANAYTLAYCPSTPATAGAMLSGGPKYDQFAPVCQTHENVMTVVVRNESPIKSILQFMAMARERADKIPYGRAGRGTVPHLSMENFSQAAPTSFIAVAYRSGGPMLTDLTGDTLDSGVPSTAAANNGKLRVLAVFADQHQPAWPDAPALRAIGNATLAPGLSGRRSWAASSTGSVSLATMPTCTRRSSHPT